MYPDLERRVLELLATCEEGKRFNQLFGVLKAGSRSTLSDCLRSLVVAGLIEHDYLTEAFNITDLGKEVLGRSEAGQREMEFLLQSRIFKDTHGAVAAAIGFWFGLMRFRLEDQIRSFLPIPIDKNGPPWAPPETESDWRQLEKTSSIIQKVRHDIENERVQRLHVFIRKHPTAAAMALHRSETEPKFATGGAWPADATNDLILAFGSDKGLANPSINALKDFLKKTYPESVDQKALEGISRKDFQDFVKRKYPRVPFDQLVVGGSRK